MVYDYFDKCIYICEWHDQNICHEVSLYYFPFDHSVQLNDLNTGRILLKRAQLPNDFKKENLSKYNYINIYNKILLIVEFIPNNFIKGSEKDSESVFVLIKPVSSKIQSKVISFILEKGFIIIQMKNGVIDKEFILQLYKDQSGNCALPLMINYLIEGNVVGLELRAPRAVKKWKDCLGDQDPMKAAPGTLRSLYGYDKIKNVAHGCKSVEISKQMIDLYFGYIDNVLRVPFNATFKNCTCCIIKPHAVIDGTAGVIWERISDSNIFSITAVSMYHMSITNAQEFYEVYKGVLSSYDAMCLQLAEGRSMVLEVICNNPSLDCVKEFRKLCGPRDPDLCRQLYPDTLRALYGRNIVYNAVHCTDLSEDGVLESEYFFKLLN